MTILKTHRVALVVTILAATISIFKISNSSPGRFLSEIINESQKYTADDICKTDDVNVTYTQEEINSARDHQTIISSIRGGNPLRDLIISGKDHSEFNSEYIGGLASVSVGWIVGFAISSLVFVACIICCCCNNFNFCKNNGEIRLPICHKRRYKIESNTKLTILTVVAILLGIGTLTSSVIGAEQSFRYEEGNERVLCKSAQLMDDAIRGNNDNNWLGIQSAVGNLQALSGVLFHVSQGLSTISTTTPNINARLTDVTTTIYDLYTFGNRKTVPRADPRETSPYKPEYISNLGPSNSMGKYTNILLNEVQEKHLTVTKSLSDLDSSIKTIKTDKASISENLDKGTSKGQDLEIEAIDLLNDIGKLEGSTFHQILLQACFIMTAMLSLGSLALIILIRFFKFKQFNCFLHIAWVGLAIFNIISWGLTAVLIPGSVFLSEVCDIQSQFLNDKAFFNNTLRALEIGDGKFNDFAFECIHNSNGKISNYLEVTPQITIFDNMFSSLKNTEPFWNGNVANSKKSEAIPIQQDLLAKTKTGIYSDSSIASTDLDSLNTLVNSQHTNCAQNLQDQWALNSVNCSTPISLKQIDPANAHLGQDFCIGFDDWIAASLDPSNRYSSTQYGSCSTINGQSYDQFVVDFVNQFSTNRLQVEILYGNLETELNKVEVANNQYMSAIQTKSSAVFRKTDSEVSNIKEALTGSKGFLYNQECAFVKEKVEKVFDSICIDWMIDVYNVAIAMGTVSCCSLFGTFTFYILATQIGMKRGTVKLEVTQASQPAIDPYVVPTPQVIIAPQAVIVPQEATAPQVSAPQIITVHQQKLMQV